MGPLELLRDRSEGWNPVVEDNPRRSFCFLRQNTWSLEKLQKELEVIVAGTNWFELQSKKSGFVTRSTAWYVPEGCCCRYTYSEQSMEPQPRPQWLEEIERRVLGEGCALHFIQVTYAQWRDASKGTIHTRSQKGHQRPRRRHNLKSVSTSLGDTLSSINLIALWRLIAAGENGLIGVAMS